MQKTKKFLIIGSDKAGCDGWPDKIYQAIAESSKSHGEKAEIKVQQWSEFSKISAEFDDFDVIIFMSDEFEASAIMLQFRLPEKRVIFFSSKGEEKIPRTPEKINKLWGLDNKALGNIFWAF